MPDVSSTAPARVLGRSDAVAVFRRDPRAGSLRFPFREQDSLPASAVDAGRRLGYRAPPMQERPGRGPGACG